MRLGFFAGGGFGFTLRVGHTLLNAIQDIFFSETGIFQVRDRAGGHCGHVLHPALQEQLHGGIRQADDVEHNGVSTDGIQLIELRDLQNLRLGEIRAGQIFHGVRGNERVLVLVRDADQRNNGVFSYACLFEANDFGHFRVIYIEFFEVLNGAGKHTSLGRRAIVREGMALATREKCEQEKSRTDLKNSHEISVCAEEAGAAGCAVGDTGTKGQGHCVDG